MSKPSIIVTCDDDAETFGWMSDGWHQVHQMGTEKAQELFKKAEECIESGDDVPDVVRRLEEAGFDVRPTALGGYILDAKP